MLSSIKSLFDSVSADTHLESSVDLTRKVSLVLMIEVALSDGNFDETERVQLVSTIAKRWKLAAPEVNDWINLAEQQQNSSTS